MITSEGHIEIRVVGEREPTLLFVHGYGCAHDDWSAQLAGLAASFRCVALDLPGHGASAMPETTTLSALASAVNVTKRRSGAREVILVGHSLGAKVVREAYLLSPARVTGVILIDGSFYVGEKDALVERARAMVDRGGFEAFARGLFDDMFLEGCDPAIKRRLIARAEKMDPKFGRDLFLETVGWDPVMGMKSLQQIDVPLLLLQATYFDADFVRRPLQPGGTATFIELVKVLVPQSETKVITDSGHFPMIDAAGTVNRHIRDFALRISNRNGRS